MSVHPYAQTNEASSNVMEEILTYDHSDFFIEITVSEPQKMGEGIGSHLVYKYVFSLVRQSDARPL